jgi:hypothetical protein
MWGLLIIAFLALSTIPSAFAEGMRSPTSSNSLDVSVEPLSDAIVDTETTQFKVTFLQPGTDIVQPHVDYDFVIEKDGRRVFSAAAQAGQPYLHTAEPIVYIPYKFEEQGEYSIRVTVSAIYFFPLEPETTTFQVAVTPEFPFALLVAAVAFATVAGLARLKHLHRSSYGFQ